LGRLIATPFVTTVGIGYELYQGFYPFAEYFPFDWQSIPNWLVDTPLDLVANTYGQMVALTPGLSPNTASSAITRAWWIPGPSGVPRGQFEFLTPRVNRPSFGF